MSATSADVLRSQEVMAFAEAAERFCKLIDRIEDLPKAYFLEQLDEHLPLLYRLACALPRYPWDDADDESEEGWRIWEERNTHVDELQTSLAQSREPGLPVDQRIEEKLRPHGRYSFVFDPVDPNTTEAIDGSIARDIESVYSDVGEALDLYQTGDELAMRQAIWDWGFGRKTHWGHHAINALSAIHWLRHHHYDEDDEVFDI